MLHQSFKNIFRTIFISILIDLPNRNLAFTDNSTQINIESSKSQNQLENDSFSLKNITNYLNNFQFRGQWKSHQDQDQLDFLTETQGDIFMVFVKNTFKSQLLDDQTELIDRMVLQLLNPKYLENRYVQSITNLSGYDINTQSWSGQSIMNYTCYEKFSNQKQSDPKNPCLVDYNVSLNFFSEPYRADSVKINIFLRNNDSSACKINLSTSMTLDTTNYQIQIISYCVLVVLICVVQVLSVTKLTRDFLENQEDVQKISLLTFGFLTIYDAHLCLENLYFALYNYYDFQYFIIPAFMYFLLATTCDMKLIWIIWRSRYLNQVFDNQQMRRAITIFFIQFYASLILFFILMYFFALNNWFILLTSLFITPQIIHNAIKGNNPKFIHKYVFGVIATNIIYQLYFRGYQYNFRGLEPSTVFCTLWVSLYFTQIFLLFIQFKFGPRSFVPKCFLAQQFNYFQNIKVHPQNINTSVSTQEQNEDCAICLGNVLIEPDQETVNISTQLLQKIMVTPCKHKFHVQCLKSWMNIKLQCPTCRKQIPPINE